MATNIDRELERIKQTRKPGKVGRTSYWQHDVNYAVYWAPGWESWQRFRLSLKGQSIEKKLERLRGYWNGSDQDANEWIRVYNYLGALLRGGFEEARPLFNSMRRGDGI
jgi:hypothetical protein